MHFGAAANRRQSLVLANQRCASGCKAQILHCDISMTQALTQLFTCFHVFDTLLFGALFIVLYCLCLVPGVSFRLGSAWSNKGLHPLLAAPWQKLEH